jgi:uncharacterized membrane protein YdbT with pleckstrin-like domain
VIALNHLPGSPVQERHVAVIRRHPITLLPLFLSALLLFLIIPVAFFGAPAVFPAVFIDPARRVLGVMGLSLFFLFGLLFLFQTFMEYWLDVAVLTDKRIVDIDQTGLFNRSISELRLHRIQDVTAETKGFLQSMFDYGDVYVQTAGEKQRFEFFAVARPNDAAKQILDLAEKDRASLAGPVEEE